VARLPHMLWVTSDLDLGDVAILEADAKLRCYLDFIPR